MKKKTIFILCAALLCVVFLFAVGYFIWQSVARDTSDDGAIDLSNRQIDGFDEALIEYLCLNGYDSSNFMVSPTAFRASLCLAAAGAQGTTRTELVTAAGFSGMNAADAWYSRLNSTARNGKFSIANSVWNNAAQMGDFTDSYKTTVEENYNAETYTREPDKLAPAINDWMNEKSDGAIPTITDDDIMGASTILVNTVNLRAAWKHAFSESATYDGVFSGVDGSEQTMRFMECTGEYLYANENNTKIVVIPLDGNLSFVCFTGNRLDMFGKMKGVQSATVRVVLPKFELESGFNARDFSGFLLERGVRNAIDERTANFYNMCKDTNWFIQEIMQKTKITIDENGVCSPTSRGRVSSQTNDDTEVNEFIADGPFSFAIFSGLGTDDQHMLLYGQMMNCD